MGNAAKIDGKDDWCKYWAFAYHAIWERRNKERHDDSFIRPYDMHGLIVSKVYNHNVAAINAQLMERDKVERRI